MTTGLEDNAEERELFSGSKVESSGVSLGYYTLQMHRHIPQCLRIIVSRSLSQAFLFSKLIMHQSYNRDLAVFVIAVPRNLRRLCIIDENDDDDYKHIIAQAKRLGVDMTCTVIGDEIGKPLSSKAPSQMRPRTLTDTWYRSRLTPF